MCDGSFTKACPRTEQKVRAAAALLLVVVGYIPGPTDASAQADLDMTRADRIVLHSPHFDNPDPIRGGLNCAARPLRLYGQESELSRVDSLQTLHVRAFRYVEPALGTTLFAPVAGVMVQLTHRIDEGVEIDLPISAGYASLTDDDGAGSLEAEPGTYRLRIGMIGFRGGDGLIQIRSATQDSLFVYMEAVAIC